MGNCQENAVILSFNISYAGSVKGNLKLISEYFKWSEYAFGSKMVEESGPMFGLGIEVKKSFPNSLNLNFGFKFLFGSVDYDGRTWGGWQVSSTTNYWRINPEIDLGILKKVNSFFIEPFVGLGLKYWKRDLESTQNALGYKEYWKVFYAPLGLRGRYMFSKDKEFFSKIALKIPIENESRMEIWGYEVSFDPGKKISMLFEAGIRFERLSLGLFYENMKFSESSPVPVFNFFLFQPESEADIWGIILRIYF